MNASSRATECARAASWTAMVSAKLVVSGFSHSTCLPACAARFAHVDHRAEVQRSETLTHLLPGIDPGFRELGPIEARGAPRTVVEVAVGFLVPVVFGRARVFDCVGAVALLDGGLGVHLRHADARSDVGMHDSSPDRNDPDGAAELDVYGQEGGAARAFRVRGNEVQVLFARVVTGRRLAGVRAAAECEPEPPAEGPAPTAGQEPAAAYAPAALNTVDDVLAAGSGPGTEVLRGFQDNTIIFKIIADQL